MGNSREDKNERRQIIFGFNNEKKILIYFVKFHTMLLMIDFRV